MTSAVLTGWGAALPERVVTNAELEARLDTTDAWIVERSGIHQRYVASADETAAVLATAAGAAAIKQAGLTPSDVGVLVLATTTPDQVMPPTSAVVHDALGLSGGAFDVNGACAGFVYAFVTAASMVEAGRVEHALVVGVDLMTRVVDPDDRSTAVLFGDGAGAVVLSAADGGGVLAWELATDGSLAGILEVPRQTGFMVMDGREVFRRAVRVVVDSASSALAQADLTAADVDLFVPHQANARIISAAADRLGIAPEHCVVNIDRYGNTSAGSIPIALTEAADAGRVHDGDVVLLSGFGAGMAWGSAVLRWKAA
ncbi:MAG: ketoacyl-ACP synthase III [Actinobacteria bacterium]|nr:ketoacyl-ACP synthase III [Actinomycetota bacterium]